jgi:hypothetical protein
VLPEDVRHARSIAPQTLEFIARGARWPETIEGPRPTEIANSRDVHYQQRLMSWIDELFKSLEQSPANSVLVRKDGSSLLEILRYRFLFEFAEVEQRLSAASEMSQTGAQRVYWVVPHSERSAIARLMGGLESPSIDVVGVPRSKKTPNRLWLWLRSYGRKALDRFQNATDSAGEHTHPAENAAGKSIAIVEYYPNSAKALVPVSKMLAEQFGIATTWIAARREVGESLDRYGIASIPLRQLTPNANRIQQHFPVRSIQILRDAIETLPDRNFFGTGTTFGKSFLVPPMIEKLLGLFEESAFWLDSLGEAFDTVRPRCVVSTTYSSTVGRAAAVAARERTVPSAFVQHGMFPDHDVFTHFCNDAMFVWGNANKRTITRNGTAESSVRVVGAPIYDQLIQRVRATNRAGLSRPGKPLRIAFMASRTGGQVVSSAIAKLHLGAIADATSQIPGATLTVKIHPADKTGTAELLLKDLPRVKVIREGNSQDVILQVDVVIVVSSTTGLEACIADKPLIVVETQGLSEYGPYREYGAALHVAIDRIEDSKRLAEAVRSLSADENVLGELARGRRRLIDDLLNGGRGDATQLTANGLAELFDGTFNFARTATAAPQAVDR